MHYSISPNVMLDEMSKFRRKCPCRVYLDKQTAALEKLQGQTWIWRTTFWRTNWRWWAL